MGAFAALVAARYLTGDGFVVALFGVALCAAAFLHASAAGALRWATRGDRTPALAAMAVSALAAVLGRAALKVTLGLDPSAAHRIDPVALGTAAISFTGAVAGVGWATVVLARRPAPKIPEVLIATLGVSACLYTLGPLLLSLGLPVGPWTFLSLAAVGVASYGARRAFSRS